jgi:hypothetical protein
MAIPGYAIGRDIAQALGLPAETTLIQITVGLDAAVEVLCRYFPTQEATAQAVQLLQHYHLVPVGAPVDASDDPPLRQDGQAAEAERLRQTVQRPLLVDEVVEAVLARLAEKQEGA